MIGLESVLHKVPELTLAQLQPRLRIRGADRTPSGLVGNVICHDPSVEGDVVGASRVRPETSIAQGAAQVAPAQRRMADRLGEASQEGGSLLVRHRMSVRLLPGTEALA